MENFASVMSALTRAHDVTGGTGLRNRLLWVGYRKTQVILLLYINGKEGPRPTSCRCSPMRSS
jgi:hypothetical protein